MMSTASFASLVKQGAARKRDLKHHTKMKTKLRKGAKANPGSYLGIQKDPLPASQMQEEDKEDIRMEYHQDEDQEQRPV